MPKPRKKSVGPKRAAIQARGVVRRNQALELRKKGATYQQIAETLRGTPGVPRSYCKANAYRDVTAELENIIAANGEAAESVRVMEILRLDRLLVALDEGIEAGDPAAINTAIRIGESRRKLLGLDAPTKIAPTTPDGDKPFSGGVLMVPCPVSPESWDEVARTSQAALKEGLVA